MADFVWENNREIRPPKDEPLYLRPGRCPKVVLLHNCPERKAALHAGEQRHRDVLLQGTKHK
jgi:hypothetical protein